MPATLLRDKILDVILEDADTVIVDTLLEFPAPGPDYVDRLGIVRNAPDAGIYYCNGISWLPAPVVAPAFTGPLVMPGNNMKIAGTAGAVDAAFGTTGPTGLYPVLKLLKGTNLNPEVSQLIYVPAGWGTAAEVRLRWAPETAPAAGATARFRSRLAPIPTGVLTTPAFVGALSAPVPAVALEVTETVLAPVHPVTAGAWHLFSLQRNSSQANDTYAGNVLLLSATLIRTA